MTVLSVPNRAVAQVATRGRTLVRPATEFTQMTRYRGGTYSHTVDTIVFIDGSTARTDLIRVNPNLHGLLPGFHRHRARPSVALSPGLLVRAAASIFLWARPRLRSRGGLDSAALLPDALTITELSRQLRQAGYPLGPANISEHEAIAGNPGRDLAFHQRPGPRHPAAERARRGTPCTWAGDHLRIRRPATTGRLLAVRRPPTPPSA